MATPTRIAVACQGGGIHAAFEVGVLTEILKDIESKNRFELVGISGTSAGALCATMVWYGLAPKNNPKGSGSVAEAVEKLNTFWDGFAATTPAEVMHNSLTYAALRAQEREVPILGINMPGVGLNPRGLVASVLVSELRQLGVRQEYVDFDAMLAAACPDFDGIDWPSVKTRLLLGASEIVGGVETAFDSDCNHAAHNEKYVASSIAHGWRTRLPVSLRAVAASGTLPSLRPAEKVGTGYYWDGLYSQNPPIREFLSGVKAEHIPEEIWVLRINPQQAAKPAETNAEILDRENELMGNLSLNKELDFILIMNELSRTYGGQLAKDYKQVSVRTIKMTHASAVKLRPSSKFNRSRSFIDELRDEGKRVAREWLDRWPKVGSYPEDAAYT